MSNFDEKVDELLEHWENAKERGEQIELETLCEDSPELLPFLKQEVEKLLSVERFLKRRDETHVPKFIGEYEVLDELGRGAVGIVFRCKHPKLAGQFGVKIIRPSSLTDEIEKRFILEADLLSTLNHPNIAKVFDVDRATYEGTSVPFFVMELIEGIPVDEFSRMKLSTTKARTELLVKVIQAVQYAHEHGVIHRDLKPQNVLVDASGEPKLLDFGIARRLGRSTTLADPNLPNQIRGTLSFLSPEQLESNSPQADVRSDIYSLGVLAYLTLSGKLPIDTADLPLIKAIDLIRAKTPAPLSNVVSNSKGDLETVISKSMSKEPGFRYASASEFAADLSRYLDGECVLARTPSLPERLIRLSKRHKFSFSFVAMSLASLLMAFCLVTYHWQNTLRYKAFAEERAKLSTNLLDAMYTDVVEKLLTLDAQSTDMRLSVVRDTRSIFEKLPDFKTGPRDLVQKKAVSYYRVAKLESRLGDFASAHATAKMALAGFEELDRRFPKDGNYSFDVFHSLLLLQFILNAQSKTDDSFEYAERAFTIIQQLAKTSKNPDHVDALSAQCRAMGTLHLEKSNYEVAAGYFKKGFTVASQLSKDHSKKVRYQKNIAHNAMCLAELKSKQGDQLGALQWYEEATVVFERLSNVLNDDVTAPTLLAAVLRQRALTLVLRKEFSQAETLLRQAIPHARRAAEMIPSVLSSWEQSLSLHETLGLILLETGRKSEARKIFMELRNLTDRMKSLPSSDSTSVLRLAVLLADHPFPEFRDLAVAEELLRSIGDLEAVKKGGRAALHFGVIQLRLGKSAEALEWFTEIPTEMYPSVSYYRAIALWDLGQVEKAHLEIEKGTAHGPAKRPWQLFKERIRIEATKFVSKSRPGRQDKPFVNNRPGVRLR